IGVGTTFAAETQGHAPKFASELASAIAEKFDLDQSEVEAVIEEQAQARRDDMREQREQKFEDMLAQAVTDGDLTQDQADEVLAKREEMKAAFEALKDETPEDRKAAMDEKVQELNDWASENDIPEQYVRFGPAPHRGGVMGGRGMGMRGGMMGQGNGSPSSDQNAF
ncbi:hypothetical protein EBS80_04895, partial [bacterium]|nr:hypothetical protein [bacterium]